MILTYENPTLLYRLFDDLGKNKLFSFIYTDFIKTLNLKGTESVLDFGSGSGAGSRHLAKILQHGHLTCVDISDFWMAKAKKRMKKYCNVDYYTGQLPELNLKSNSFDVIYIFYVLHDVEKEYRSGILNEMFRLLKEDGRICIKEPQREYDGMPVAEIKELMTDSGFYEVCAKEEKGTYRAEYSKK